MRTTEEMLGLISALRQRLEQAEPIGTGPEPGAEPAGDVALKMLRHRLAVGNKAHQVLQLSLQQAAGNPADSERLPDHLTSGAVRLLRQARDVLHDLKKNAAEPLLQEENHPVALHYQDTVLLADLLLRAIQTLPEKTSLQMRLCSALDVLLGVIQQRAGGLEWQIKHHRHEEQKVAELAKLLRRLYQGTLENVNPFFALAEVIVREASEGQPLTFPSVLEAEPARCAASHSLAAARVIVRIARDDSPWSGSLLQPVVAALAHDVGMLSLPAEFFTQVGDLDADQRLLLERHCRTGAALLAKPAAAHPWLIEATRSHHERPDGTGYPAGSAEGQIDALAGLVAVCDAYAALCSPRPYRDALDTRSALKETMSMAQKGQLDRNGARLLPRLTAFPAGTAVELNDGSRGVVVAVDRGGGLEERPARPVVALLVAGSGRPFPFPQVVDLSAGEQRHVHRGLTAAERSKWFGPCYPQYAS